jgi:hypothetical protein
MQAPDSSRRTRYWRSFSLRAFFCVVTLICIATGWWVAATKRQKEVADWIASFDRTPYYSYRLNAAGRPARDAETPLRKWITNRFGVDSVYSIRSVHLDNRPVKDISLLSRLHDLRHVELDTCGLTDISPIAGLRKLEVVSIIGNDVSDISAMENLTNLRVLSAMRTPVKDIAPLKRLTKLEVLELTDTQIDDISPLTDLSSLTHLNISRTNVTDIAPLASVKSLATLNVSGTKVTSDMVAKLQEQLPNCKITY